MAELERFIFLLLCVVQFTTAARFKVAVSLSEADYTRRSVEDACSEYETVADPEDFLLPQGFQHLQRPWVDNPLATTGTSATVTQGIDSLFRLKVPGLGGQRIADVIEELKIEGCLSFPWGGSVRDQFLGAPPEDLDMESNCSPDKMQNICKEKWGPSNCPRFGPNITHIGDFGVKERETDVLDAANWKDTFFGNGAGLEYTTNSIAYFAEEINIVIDITGRGISDTCSKTIRIPVPAEDRDEWKSSEKLYRFWKLRVKVYTAADTDTMSYIVKGAKESILKDPEKFKKFYCKTVLDGNWTNSQCEIEGEKCSGALEKKEKYDTVFEMDLGEFWSNTANEVVHGLECNSCGGVLARVQTLPFLLCIVTGVMMKYIT